MSDNDVLALIFSVSEVCVVIITIAILTYSYCIKVDAADKVGKK